MAVVGAILLTGGPSEVSEYAEINAVVSDAFVSDDPAICEAVLTDNWLEQNFQSDEQDPLSRCREAVTEDPTRRADSAELSALEVDGDRAQVTVHASGGNFGEGTLELELVADDGWRLDELTGFEADPQSFFAAQRRSLSSTDAPEYAKPLLECMIDWADTNVGADELERATLAGNEDFYTGAYGSCTREFRAMMFSPVTIGAETGYSPEQLLCISRVANATASDRDLREAFEALATHESAPSSFDVVKDTAIKRCA